jgi:hypothetical protein
VVAASSAVGARAVDTGAGVGYAGWAGVRDNGTGWREGRCR